MYYMTSKHPVIAVEMSIGWRRVPFVSFSSCASKTKMDTFKSIEKVSVERENRSLPYQKSSIYSTILFFPLESIEEALGTRLACSMIPTENSDFLVCTCMVRDRQQETQNIKLCLALCWLFDIKLLVTLSLVVWFPLRQIRAKIAIQTRAFK